MRPRLKTRSISTVHRPMPRTWVILDTISLSSSVAISCMDGTVPCLTLSARSLKVRIFPRENPAERICSSVNISISSGSGNVLPGTSLMKRPRIASAAAPCSCWEATARESASNGDWLRSGFRPNAADCSMSPFITGSASDRNFWADLTVSLLMLDIDAGPPEACSATPYAAPPIGRSLLPLQRRA